MSMNLFVNVIAGGHFGCWYTYSYNGPLSSVWINRNFELTGLELSRLHWIYQPVVLNENIPDTLLNAQYFS